MKRIGLQIIAIISFFLISTSSFSETQGKITTIVIDAGHGGHDPGALGKNSKEKEVALSIALKLGKLIEDNYKDVNVIYTRKTDVFIELWKRAFIANKAGADLFISIHCNSVDGKSAYGTETFTMGFAKNEYNLKIAQKENASILLEDDYEEKYDGFDPNSPTSYALFSLFQDAYHEQSIDFASKIQDNFRVDLGRRDRGVKQERFLVLARSTMPRVLIETGFLSNPNEEKFLLSQSGQNKISKAIYEAFKEYKEFNDKHYAETGKLDSLNTKTTIENPNVIIVKEEVKTSEETKNKVIFKVQIASSPKKKPLNSPAFKGLNVEYYKHMGMYKYTYGNSTSFSDMVIVQKKMRSRGFKDAFVVAFKDGERLDINEARRLSAQ